MKSEIWEVMNQVQQYWHPFSTFVIIGTIAVFGLFSVIGLGGPQHTQTTQLMGYIVCILVSSLVTIYFSCVPKVTILYAGQRARGRRGLSGVDAEIDRGSGYTPRFDAESDCGSGTVHRDRHDDEPE
ncbi:hypothetical protein GCM10009039_05140 [Halocalculus aciditolerans]|uniref:Uncharacterized protein n=1 Tax=Halocalculus aciditolerans TaxID=1383812 RepID=A0A830F877_9EURY|nr:hypothetical protein GCM10009039_05140 [Halocalculus aciditolerans]